MVIQIDGINTENKGAELMLVAILEEIESRMPGSTVWLNPNGELDLSMLPSYNLNIKQRFFLKNGRIFRGLLRRLRLPYIYFTHFYPAKGIDIMLDASGFQFSDQWNHSAEVLQIRERYYAGLKKHGTKIVLLPQAFGPFETPNGKKSVEIISRYFDLIFAREQVSYNYLSELAGKGKALISKSCDFTFKVKGIVPTRYAGLKHAVCIIPNKKMITHTKAGKSAYVDLMNNLIRYFQSENKNVFLLNHEGVGDQALCEELSKLHGGAITIVNNLSAKEVKGVIGNSFLVVSSRFHGVASALSQGVPCLATSWNHKYEMLFNDFSQTDRILEASKSWGENESVVRELLLNYEEASSIIKSRKIQLQTEIDKMWGIVLG